MVRSDDNPATAAKTASQADSPDRPVAVAGSATDKSDPDGVNRFPRGSWKVLACHERAFGSPIGKTKASRMAAARPRDWTTWLIVAVVVLLTVVAFVLLASTYFPPGP
jgi:hypothetical protein